MSSDVGAGELICIVGDLKTSLDHIYHEWAKMPFGVITYGGRVGSICAQALSQVLQGIGADTISIEKVMVKLPPDHVAGPVRTDPAEEYLNEFDGVLDEELGKVVESAKKRQGSKKEDIFHANEKAREKPQARAGAKTDAADAKAARAT